MYSSFLNFHCLGLFRNSPVERSDDNECTVDDLIERQVRKAIYSRFGYDDNDGMELYLFIYNYSTEPY